MTQIKITKAFLLIFILLVSRQFSYGQKTEINFNAYSGLFSFRGAGSSSTSWINFNPYTSPDKFTSNPYGKKSEFSYSLELQAQRVTKTKNIYGVGISFEALTSKVTIDTVTQNGFIYWQYSADGKTSLKNTFVTLNPFIGHRFCLKSMEKGNATAGNKTIYTADNDKAKPSIDFRPRIQIKTQLKKVGLLVGYSLGLTNYQTQNTPKAYSSYLRLGLSYKLK
jgi:hypothetical protein